MIRDLTVTRGGEHELVISAVVAARDPGLNPSLLDTAIKKYCPEAAPDFVSYRREALFDAEMRVFC
jgi:hypothetical protein